MVITRESPQTPITTHFCLEHDSDKSGCVRGSYEENENGPAKTLNLCGDRLPGVCRPVYATETENLGIAVLPAPDGVAVDGKCDDWDLSGGIFICGDVENMRDKLPSGFTRCMTPKPLPLGPLDRRNAAQQPRPASRIVWVRGRLPAGADRHARQAAGVRNHFTCWRDRNGEDTIFVEVGKDFKGGTIKDAKPGQSRRSRRTSMAKVTSRIHQNLKTRSQAFWAGNDPEVETVGSPIGHRE